ncbi:MAG: hypothetical protein KF760_12065 [Candidatus Eremiobacteraeota bacterium]|nr:hypothetical protein [Candidatus Eremiobacteraeota bacterium]MCW5868202.1 hypothetical protein [Candidatus Eremiobacteraeota bacterium]
MSSLFVYQACASLVPLDWVRKTLTQDFQNKDLVRVIKTVAKSLDYNVTSVRDSKLCVVPSASVPTELALGEILRMQGKEFASNVQKRHFSLSVNAINWTLSTNPFSVADLEYSPPGVISAESFAGKE